MRVKKYTKKQFYLLFIAILIIYARLICISPISLIEHSEVRHKASIDTITMKKNNVRASQCSIIDTARLKSLYKTGDDLVIQGDGYAICIKGKEILNYHNEVESDINLINEKKEISFCINNGNELCAPLYVRIDSIRGKYLYLYNEIKEKYEYIKVNDLGDIKITTPGKYLITNEQITSTIRLDNWIFYSGFILILGGIILYIITKKRYWFW